MPARVVRQPDGGCRGRIEGTAGAGRDLIADGGCGRLDRQTGRRVPARLGRRTGRWALRALAPGRRPAKRPRPGSRARERARPLRRPGSSRATWPFAAASAGVAGRSCTASARIAGASERDATAAARSPRPACRSGRGPPRACRRATAARPRSSPAPRGSRTRSRPPRSAAPRPRSAGSGRVAKGSRGGCAAGGPRRPRGATRRRRARRVRTTKPCSARHAFRRAGRHGASVFGAGGALQGDAPGHRRGDGRGREHRLRKHGRAVLQTQERQEGLPHDPAQQRIEHSRTLPAEKRRSVPVSRLPRDGALVAEALAVVGLLVADVLGALVGVRTSRSQCAPVRSVRPAASSNSRCVSSPRISAERRCNAGTAKASRGSPSGAKDAATSPCTIGRRALHPHRQRRHALAEHEQEPRADPVDGFAEHRLAPRRGLAERAHHARDLLIVRARDAAAVIALARRHVQHSQELSEVHRGVSVKHVRPLDSTDHPCERIHTCP